MAVLRAPDPEQPYIVPARCLIGRSRACDLVLAARDVSSQHAVLQWSGDRWEVQDLGSRNGTFVEDVRVPAGARVTAPRGAKLRFGREATWALVDAAGLTLFAVEVATGEARAARRRLPDAADAAGPGAVRVPGPAGRVGVRAGRRGRADRGPRGRAGRRGCHASSVV